LRRIQNERGDRIISGFHPSTKMGEILAFLFYLRLSFLYFDKRG
jgi:hypothetical protein